MIEYQKGNVTGMFKVIGIIDEKAFTFATAEDLQSIVPCIVHLMNSVYPDFRKDLYIIKVVDDEISGAQNIEDFCDRNHIDLTRR